jgi:hypothetical protein
VGSCLVSRGWGGSRLRADRLSDRLTLPQCRKLLNAALFAEHIGLPFNRHWIVHSERAGVLPKDGQRFVGHLLRLASDTAKRRGGDFAAVYTRENGDGKGEHIHILMHYPPGAKLTNKTRRWVETAGGKYRRRVSRVTRIGGSLRIDPASEHYQANADKVVGYLLKAADQETAAKLGLEDFGEFGWIRGKRSGSTHNIAMAAQMRLAGEA